MGQVKIPYYVVKRGSGFWQPTKAMRALGFASTPCGRDGPGAWEEAARCNETWRVYRVGGKAPLIAGPRVGSLAEAFGRYQRTAEWDKKARRTREEWARAWARIDPIFGDLAPRTVDLESLSDFRAAVAESVSEREAHRCIKIWRALWRVAAALGYVARDADPSLGIRNTEPAPRQALWREGEVVRMVKVAWRNGYHGLAAVIAVGWDTQFSPVDLRGLISSQAIEDANGLAFAVARAKTGRAAIGTLSARAAGIVDAYIAALPFNLMHNAAIFRNRSHSPYSKDTLGDDFRAVRALAFGSAERRTLSDFRRSGAVEAISGGATAAALSTKMANDLSSSNQLHKTYVPVDMATVRQVDEARKKARRKS